MNKDLLVRLGDIVSRWRSLSGESLYGISKDTGLRLETLKRIEQGESVTSANLLLYLQYIQCAGCDVMASLWKECGYGDENAAVMDTAVTAVFDRRTKQFVRYLKEEEMNGRFREELAHDNIKMVYRDVADDKEVLTYQTKEMLYNTLVMDPEDEYRKGDLGTVDISRQEADGFKGDLQKIACCYAVGAGCSYDGAKRVYTNIVNERWQVVDAAQADRSITLCVDGKEKCTFCFKRLWLSESRD